MGKNINRYLDYSFDLDMPSGCMMGKALAYTAAGLVAAGALGTGAYMAIPEVKGFIDGIIGSIQGVF